MQAAVGINDLGRDSSQCVIGVVGFGAIGFDHLGRPEPVAPDVVGRSSRDAARDRIGSRPAVGIVVGRRVGYIRAAQGRTCRLAAGIQQHVELPDPAGKVLAQRAVPRRCEAAGVGHGEGHGWTCHRRKGIAIDDGVGLEHGRRPSIRSRRGGARDDAREIGVAHSALCAVLVEDFAGDNADGIVVGVESAGILGRHHTWRLDQVHRIGGLAVARLRSIVV